MPEIIMKQCPVCKQVKPADDFVKSPKRKGGLSWDCRDCAKIRFDEWRNNNPKRYRERQMVWEQRNLENERARKSKWQKEHRELRHVYFRKRDSISKWGLSHCMRTAIGSSLRQGVKSGRRWEALVGYTIGELKDHIEKQFEGWMSWENHGKWHIDHILPISVFNFEKPEDIDFKRCWALENLRPLEARENRRKSNRVDGDFQPSLLLSNNNF